MNDLSKTVLIGTVAVGTVVLLAPNLAKLVTNTTVGVAEGLAAAIPGVGGALVKTGIDTVGTVSTGVFQGVVDLGSAIFGGGDSTNHAGENDYKSSAYANSNALFQAGVIRNTPAEFENKLYDNGRYIDFKNLSAQRVSELLQQDRDDIIHYSAARPRSFRFADLIKILNPNEWKPQTLSLQDGLYYERRIHDLPGHAGLMHINPNQIEENRRADVRNRNLSKRDQHIALHIPGFDVDNERNPEHASFQPIRIPRTPRLGL